MNPAELHPGLDGVCFAFWRNAPERTIFRVAWKAFRCKFDVCVEAIQGDYTTDTSQEKRQKEGEGKQSKLDIISRVSEQVSLAGRQL